MKDIDAGGNNLNQDRKVGRTITDRETGTAKPERALHTEKQLPLRLQDCTKNQCGRDLPKIVDGWKRFSRIESHSATCREDVKSARQDGVKALSNFLPVALRDSHQSSVSARFLLNIYSGPRFPKDVSCRLHRRYNCQRLQSSNTSRCSKVDNSLCFVARRSLMREAQISSRGTHPIRLHILRIGAELVRHLQNS